MSATLLRHHSEINCTHSGLYCYAWLKCQHRHQCLCQIYLSCGNGFATHFGAISQRRRRRRHDAGCKWAFNIQFMSFAINRQCCHSCILYKTNICTWSSTRETTLQFDSCKFEIKQYLTPLNTTVLLVIFRIWVEYWMILSFILVKHYLNIPFPSFLVNIYLERPCEPPLYPSGSYLAWTSSGWRPLVVLWSSQVPPRWTLRLQIAS